MLFSEPVAAPIFSEDALDGGVGLHVVGDWGGTTESEVEVCSGAEVFAEIVSSAAAALIRGLGEAPPDRSDAVPVFFVEADDGDGGAARP